MDLKHPMIRLTGTDKPLPEVTQLKAGILHCTYESGMIRYVSVGDEELIRCMYSAVRDRNWGTLIPEITGEAIRCNEKSFTLSYHALYKSTDIHFEADYTIVGTEDNQIMLAMEGNAVTSFLKNRIGFCILHPLQGIKGKSCLVSQNNGRIIRAAFPPLVSPHSPMVNISSLEWKHEGIQCRLMFSGDIWEMEDHRNWTDASFKSYCTPLSLPFPASVAAGSKVEQTVRLEVSSETRDFAKTEGVHLFMETSTLKPPYIGTCSPAGRAFAPAEAAILKKAGLHHLRFDLIFDNSDCIKGLETAVLNATAIGAGLELVLHFSEQIGEEIQRFQSTAVHHHAIVNRVWAVDKGSRLSDNRLIEQVVPVLRRMFPGSRVGAGTDAYFAELNRNRFNAHTLDFVSFAVCPQVHAFDNGTLVENLEAQCDVIESAGILYPGKAVQVSPVTLKQRFNVVATAKESSVPADQLPVTVDERQMSMFAAGWTLGSLASLAKGGAEAATYYEAIGWKGLIQGEGDPEKPDLFAGRAGDIFPVYHVLRLFYLHQDAHIIFCNTQPALKCVAMALEKPDGMLWAVANLTGVTVPLHINGFNPKEYAVWNGSNIEESYHDPEFLDHLQFQSLPDPTPGIEAFSFMFLR
jgi:D-apionolactonase